MSALPPESTIWRLTRGALATRTLAIVADLGVADALATGPRPVTELADELGADHDALRRYLRALASDGVFEEREPGTFANTPASEQLRERAGWREFAHLFGGDWHRAAGALDATGESPFARTFGTDFWSWLDEHPDERAAFDRAMGSGKERVAERLAVLDWQDGELVVDVGGGSGALLVELLRRRPGLRGIVFDLPETVRDESTFPEGCEFVAGDFFVAVPAGATYVLSGILHDWDDAHAARILRTIRTSAPAGARVVATESVVPPGNEPHGAKWLDLLMLVLAGGRERSEDEWRALLETAGLEPVRIKDGLVEARCP